MAIVQNGNSMTRADAFQFFRKCSVVWRVIGDATGFNFVLGGMLSGLPDLLAIEVGERAERGRVLTRIKRGAGWIAVSVNYVTVNV